MIPRKKEEINKDIEERGRRRQSEFCGRESSLHQGGKVRLSKKI